MTVTIALIFLAGCGSDKLISKNEQKTQDEDEGKAEKSEVKKYKKIRFLCDWNTELERYDAFHEALNKWLADNPEMDVEVEVALDPDNKTKMQVELAAGNIPDVFKWWVTPTNAANLYENDAVLDTNTIIEASNVLTQDMFPMEARSTGTYKGVSYGLPIYGTSGYFVINKELYDEYNVPIPKTYEDFREGAKIFIENGIIPFASGSVAGNPSHYWMSALWVQFPNAVEEIDAIAEGGNIASATGISKKVAEIIQEDISLGMYPRDPVANNADACFAMVMDGRAAACYAMSYQMFLLSPEDNKKIELISTPRVEGGSMDTDEYYYMSPTNGYQVSKKGFEDTEKREPIMKLVEFLCSPEIINLWAETEEMNVNMEIDSSAYSEARLKMEEFKKDRTPYSAVHFTRINNATIWTEYKNKIDELYSGLITPDEFEQAISKVWEDNK